MPSTQTEKVNYGDYDCRRPYPPKAKPTLRDHPWRLPVGSRKVSLKSNPVVAGLKGLVLIAEVYPLLYNGMAAIEA